VTALSRAPRRPWGGASPRAQALRRRGWLAALALTLLLAAGLSLMRGEAAGWPSLAQPVQRLLSQVLERPVQFSGAQPLRVQFWGGLRLSATRLVVDAPLWSSAPPMVADDVVLALRYRDLWRAWRGQPLRVQFWSAARVHAHLERLADGRASWQFGPHPLVPTAPAVALPSWGQLHIAAADVHYRDQLQGLEMHLSGSLHQGAPSLGLRATPHAALDGVLQLQAQGHYRQQPFQVELRSTGALPWTDAPRRATLVAPPLALTLHARVGRAELSFAGSSTHIATLAGLEGRFTLSGPSLAAVGHVLGVTLPTTAAFTSNGVLVREGQTWHVRLDKVALGGSRLRGAFSYQRDRPVPLLSGQLGGERLLLTDLVPMLGTTTAARRGAGKVLPTQPFDLVALRAMDADVQIDLAEGDLNARWLEPLRPLRAHLQLVGGVLTLRKLQARTGQGTLRGTVLLDGRGPQALWRAELAWDGVRLEHWVHQARAGGKLPWLAGRLSGWAQVQGQGRSTADILASLQGRIRTELEGGTVSHLAVEMAGLDVAESLGVWLKGDNALAVPCAVADWVGAKGVFHPQPWVLDSSDSTIWVEGTVSLASEQLDLRAVVAPKDFSLLALRTPLRVRGSLVQPVVTFDKGRLSLKLAAAWVLATVLNPLTAVLPLLDPGDAAVAQRGALQCRQVRARGKQPPPSAIAGA
jgi:uncharacterized protein involved in outer membrane biogenesis